MPNNLLTRLVFAKPKSPQFKQPTIARTIETQYKDRIVFNTPDC